MKTSVVEVIGLLALVPGTLGLVSRSVIQPCRWSLSSSTIIMQAANDGKSGGGNDNKAMAFLRKIGKVGGAANQDFTNAMGVDEGAAGKQASRLKNIRKSRDAYQSCVKSGVIDDLSEPFPITASGTQWSGVTDSAVGGSSSGTLSREEYEGRTCNVLRASIKGKNNDDGFVQMATDLALDPSVSSTVDASDYDGIEMELCAAKPASFNLQLKNNACVRRLWAYRTAFELPKMSWTKVRIPFNQCRGHGEGIADLPLDTTSLQRLGIVARGAEDKDVTIALSSIRFYKE